jgi:hypothetical protein
MKCLFSLDLAAAVPSPSIVVKNSFSLLRVFDLSAGLIARTATVSPIHAATSGTITATATAPVACSVSGATITIAE